MPCLNIYLVMGMNRKWLVTLLTLTALSIHDRADTVSYFTIFDVSVEVTEKRSSRVIRKESEFSRGCSYYNLIGTTEYLS